MGGGGNLVDGVRRWLFQRPSSSSSSNNQNEPILLSSATFSNRVQSGEAGDLNELVVSEDFDFTGLKLLKVPKRNHLPMDPQKKVPFCLPFSCFFLFMFGDELINCFVGNLDMI